MSTDNNPHPYGDPEDWDGAMPVRFQVSLVEALEARGWTTDEANDTFVTVVITPRPQLHGDPHDTASIWFHHTGWHWATHPEQHSGRHDNPGQLSCDTRPDAVAKAFDTALRSAGATPDGAS